MLMTIAIPSWMNLIQAQNINQVQNLNQALNQVPAPAVPVQAVPVPVPIQDQVHHLMEALLVVLAEVPHLVEVLLLADHLVALVTLQVSY